MALPKHWIAADQSRNKESGQAWIHHVRRSSDPPSGPFFALKRLKNPKRRARFAREIEVMRSLVQRGVTVIPEITESDLLQEPAYYVMPWFDGGSLEDAVQDHRFFADPVAAIDLLIELARGLKQVHMFAYAHRDLKPANVLLAERGIRIADFGLCLGIDEDNLRHTATGEVVGSRLYTAPENESGMVETVDQRPADFYAFGKIVWAVLAGRQPPPREQHRDPGWRLEELVRDDRFGSLAVLLERLLHTDPRVRLGDWDAIIGELEAFRQILNGSVTPIAKPSAALEVNLMALSELRDIREENERERRGDERREWSERLLNVMKNASGEFRTRLESMGERCGNSLRFAVTHYDGLHLLLRSGPIASRVAEVNNRFTPLIQNDDGPVAFIVHSPQNRLPLPIFALAVVILVDSECLWLCRIPLLQGPPGRSDLHVAEFLLSTAFRIQGPLPCGLLQTEEAGRAFVSETGNLYFEMLGTYTKQAMLGHGERLLTAEGWVDTSSG